MQTRKRFILTTLFVALCGLSVSAYFGWRHHQEPQGQRSSAAWKEKYATVEELVNRVDAVVLARAVAVQPGRIAYSANGEDALPFEVVQFEVLGGIKGVRNGEQVFVERAGGVDPQGNEVNIDIDGGEFEIGSNYLLFLKRQEDGPYYYQVNDQGRFRVAGKRLAAAFPDDEVAAAFHGRLVGEGVEIVKQKIKAAR